MEEIILYVGLIVFLAVCLLVRETYTQRKLRNQQIIKIQKEYGDFPSGKPDSILRNAEKYYEYVQTEDGIDDITWNDLDMDLVYQRMNYTRSAAGSEWLYKLLRTPIAKVQELEKRNLLIQSLMQDESKRMKLSTALQEIGFTGKYSLSEYLDYLDQLEKRSNFKHIVLDLLYIPAIALLFDSFGTGFLAIFLLLSVNVTTYFKEKGELNPYLVSFGYILRMTTGSRKIMNLHLDILKEQDAILEKDLRVLSKFEKFSGIAMSMNNPVGSTNPFSIFSDYVKIILHIDLIKFNQMLSVVKENRKIVEEMVETIGFLDAMASVAYYRASLEKFCIPQFDTEGKTGLNAEQLYHPLISNPVKNSISEKTGVLLTGSNASGKSTFLKTVAINAVLAQTICTVLADSYHTDFYRIYSSMALRDNLTGGESYFIVEIKALKRILSEVAGDKQTKVLCFVDEVLRGTNTVERIAASSTILRSLSGRNVMCFAATHDIELTYLLENIYENYHFEEQIADEDILFNYTLLKGRATSRNAIKLLEVMGYDKDVVDKAASVAEKFMETGKWEASQ